MGGRFSGLLVFALCCSVVCAAEKGRTETIFDPDAMAAKAVVSGIANDAGKWETAKYGFTVLEAKKEGKSCKAIHSEWKAFQSKFTFKTPLLSGDELLFSFCKTGSNKTGEAFAFLYGGGKSQAGVRISNDLTVSYLDVQAPGKEKLSSVPAEQFTIKPGQWHSVRMVFHPNGNIAGSYDLYLDDKKIKEAIGYAFNPKDISDALSLRGCNYGQGGNEILFGAFMVKRGGQTLEEYQKTSSMNMEVLPGNSEVGTLFVAGKSPVFHVTIQGAAPGMKVAWSVRKLYSEDSASCMDGEISVNAEGQGDITLPADIMRMPYLLVASGRLGNQDVFKKNIPFAVMSGYRAEKIDLEKEWLGIDTIELDAGAKHFEDTVKVLKLIGVHWVRKKHTWAQQYPSLQEGPQMDGLRKTADFLEKENIKTVEDIQGTPGWASAAPEDGASRWKYPPSKWEYWNTYIRALVKALGNRTQYQLWCEPCSWMAIDRIEKEYPDGIPQVLNSYWSYTRKAIDELCPEAQLIGPAVSSGNMSTVDLVIRNGSCKQLNALTFHYPKWPNTPRSTNQRVLREMTRYGHSKIPMICDESITLSYAKLADRPVAINKLQTYIRYWAEGLVERYFSYVLHAPDRRGDLVTAGTFQPKGGLVEFQSLILRTRNAEFIGKVTIQKEIESYLYMKNGKPCLVLWNSSEEQKEVPLDKLLTGLVKNTTICYDEYSNPLKNTNVGLSTAPYYLEDINPERFGSVLAQLQPVELRLDSDIALPVSLTIANLTGEATEVGVDLNDPNAKILPERLAVKLAPYQVLRQQVTIQPRAPEKTGFTSGFIKAQVNQKETDIGFAQYFYCKGLKTIDAGQFADGNLWKIGGKSGIFEHGAAMNEIHPNEKSGLAYHQSKQKDGSIAGLFSANLKPAPKTGWLGINYDRGEPLVIPGIPVNLRFKIHATTQMLPSNAGLLLKFMDAKGKVMNYQITPFISPSDKNNVMVMESLIDSPVSNSYRHSQTNAGDPNYLFYPLKFIGFSINPTPQRDKKSPWVGALEVLAIEFDCYDSPIPVEKVAQVYDPTPQF